MRDIKRIHPIMEELEKLWLSVPDQRFWQFLMNLSQYCKVESDPFYMEDDEALKRLQEARTMYK